MNNQKKCCICGQKYHGYETKPSPVKENGLCCDACNFGVVIPIRLARLAKRETEEAQNAGSKV